MRVVHSLIAILGISAPALAQDGPSFDCANAGSEAESLICSDADLARLDRRLADRFGAALSVVQGLDAGAADAEAELRATQRGWISGRDDCWKAEDLRACVSDAYLRREGELVATWQLEEPAETVSWTCGGTPANEVVTLFFDTELPSVRFERGDTIDAGTLSRTASGARYDGSFGRFIWMNGDEATYREPDPDGTEYTCTVAARR